MKSILILSKSKIIARIVKSYLTRLDVKNIYWSTKTEESFKIIANENIDLIISEVDLKNMTIFDFAKKVPDTNILVITTDQQAQELDHWFKFHRLNKVIFPFSSIGLKDGINRIHDKEALLDLPI